MKGNAMMYERLCLAAANAPATSGLHEGDRFVSYSQVAERAGRHRHRPHRSRHRARHARRPADGQWPRAAHPRLRHLRRRWRRRAAQRPRAARRARHHCAQGARRRRCRLGALRRRRRRPDRRSWRHRQMPLFVAGGTGDNSVADLERHSLGTLPKLGEDDAALYMFSSGSTGIPKVVPHTHGELDHRSARRRANGQRYPTDDVMINMMPGSHAMGFLSATSMSPLPAPRRSTGATRSPSCCRRAASPTPSPTAASRMLMGVPFMFDALAEPQGRGRFLAACASRSPPASRSARRPIDRFKARFGIAHRARATARPNASASRSTTATIPTLRGTRWARPSPRLDHADRAGRQSVRPRIRRDRRQVPRHHQGLSRRARGQRHDPARRPFYTGDLGDLDANGHVFIKGRTKLLIEVAGHKVDPFEIEEVLGTHPVRRRSGRRRRSRSTHRRAAPQGRDRARTPTRRPTRSSAIAASGWRRRRSRPSSSSATNCPRAPRARCCAAS